MPSSPKRTEISESTSRSDTRESRQRSTEPIRENADLFVQIELHKRQKLESLSGSSGFKPTGNAGDSRSGTTEAYGIVNVAPSEKSEQFSFTSPVVSEGQQEIKVHTRSMEKDDRTPQQKVEDQQRKHVENQKTLQTLQERLDDRTLTVEGLERWNMHDSNQNDLRSWRMAHSEASQRRYAKIAERGLTVYDQINTKVRDRITLEDHLAYLYGMKQEIVKEKKELLSFRKGSVQTYGTLRLEITENILYRIERENLLQKVDGFDKAAEHLDSIISATISLEETIDDFIAEIQKASKGVKGVYTALEDQKPDKDHLFFQEKDMFPAGTNMPFVNAGEALGSSVIHMVRTLLLAQDSTNIMADEAFLAAKLGLHPEGGGIEVEKLHTILPSLRDQNGLHYRKIEPKELKIALGEGPLGAFFDTTQSGILLLDKSALTLDRLVQDPKTKEQQVVVLDQSRPRPYRISLDTVVKASNGEVLLSHDALNAINQYRQSANLPRLT
jgi:hypothetical protein